MKATIIITDIVSQGMLLYTVHALCTQNYPQELYTVILPDLGNFTKEEATLLREFEQRYPHFRILHNPGKNRSMLLNLAAHTAQGDILLFIESHCAVHNTWLKEFMAYFTDTKIHAALGAIKTVPTRSPVGQAEEYQRRQIMQRMRNLGVDSSYLDFHNTAIRKTTFQQLGGLSPKLPVFAEFELGARLHQQHITIHHVPIIIWHFNDTTLSSYSQVIAKQGRDKARILGMHGKKFIDTYFPLPRFTRYTSLVRLFRIPLIFITVVIIRLSIIGFLLATALRMPTLSQIFFRTFARNSHRKGLLIGLA